MIFLLLEIIKPLKIHEEKVIAIWPIINFAGWELMLCLQRNCATS